tara:strand:- start:4968 stop:5099 length:132 start_codon:yes stop_codon:yes gene_type:complete
MNKKIGLILTIFFLIISCGKKADPEYKVSKNKNEIKVFLINKA